MNLQATSPIRVPVLILGSGLAGMSCALELAERGYEVLIVSKSDDLFDCNSALAQGGVVYRNETSQPADPATALKTDIVNAGDGVCNLPAVDQLVGLGQKLVTEKMLENYHVPFDRNAHGDLQFSREAAHSTSRIVHVGDRTGWAIQEAFLKAARSHPKIQFLLNHTAIDLLTTQHSCRGYEFKYSMSNECCGAYLLDNATSLVKTVVADFTVLATGGVGQLFLHSSNSLGAIGDGLAMGVRAGAAVLFPHYIQFHPTALAKGKRRFLISEAARGEGAVLLNSSGERFMKKYNPQQMELAPRDELSRAIIREMVTRDDDCVYLDFSTYKGDVPLAERFPGIFAECMRQGLDIRNEPIPVVPAAHYLCGGIKVDLAGRTTLSRLFAVGEVSCTGLHGANRLASTSLLECLTWGTTSGQAIAEQLQNSSQLPVAATKAIRSWEYQGTDRNLDRQRLAGDWTRLRTTMWNYVGIVRTTQLLHIAAKDLRLLSENLTELYHNTRISKELVDLFHGIQACRVIVEEALKDPVSLGCHYLTK